MKLTPWALAVTALVASSLALGAPVHGALAPLPADGAQVNDDPANSIDRNQDAGVVDVAGGTVVAGNVQVPWATFEQKVGSSQQIFVRAFKNGAWVTQGFPASLNIDPTKEAEAPSIDFAGHGSHRALGGVVRAQRRLRRADEHLREPLQRRRERVAAVGPGPDRRRRRSRRSTSTPTGRRRTRRWRAARRSPATTRCRGSCGRRTTAPRRTTRRRARSSCRRA